MSSDITVDAVVTYSAGKSVDRGIPIASGFQPFFCVEDKKIAVEYTYPEGEVVYPGDSVSLSMRMKAAEISDVEIYKGMSFELMKVDTRVGEGTIRTTPRAVE